MTVNQCAAIAAPVGVGDKLAAVGAAASDVEAGLVGMVTHSAHQFDSVPTGTFSPLVVVSVSFDFDAVGSVFFKPRLADALEGVVVVEGVDALSLCHMSVYTPTTLNPLYTTLRREVAEPSQESSA